MATRNTLSRELIVGAAVAMLDREGEDGLTFRALAADLRTGAGAIYWHVTNKNELLAAATEAILTGAIAAEPGDQSPEEGIRAAALGVLDAVSAHPWVGAQLARLPSQPAILRVFERIGRHIRSLGVPDADQFNSASALLNFILGVAGQQAALAREVDPGVKRTEFLESISARLDPAEYPFTHHVGAQLRDHDDRQQFLAGVDLILAGIAAIPKNAATAAIPKNAAAAERPKNADNGELPKTADNAKLPKNADNAEPPKS
jgi:AcrR family transcriptional regulator